MHCSTLARRPICAALFGAVGLSVAPAFADSLPQGATPPPAAILAASTRGDPALLDPVTVTATRTATAASRTAASVSVITDEDLEEQQAANIKDALRYEPGVTVRRQSYRPDTAGSGGGREGNSSINIRGLEGNRVLIMEDGIRQPSMFSFGPVVMGRGDYTDLDMFKRIEILRGPASTLYGSDGLTGAVSFLTKDPADLLSIYHKPTYFSFRPGYDSTDRSVGATASMAAGNDRVQGLLILDGRRGHESDTRGSNNSASTARTTANPQATYTQSALGKLVFTPTSRDTIKLTGETVRRRVSTDVLSAVAPPALLGLTAYDRFERNRVSIDYDFKDTDFRWFQTGHVQVYYQDSKQEQHAFETRGRNPPTRTRDNEYAERMVGGSAFAESGFKTGPLLHQLVYGLDGSLNRIKGLRNGTVPAQGESFPSKAFPDTDYTLFGTFVQDRISYGKFIVTPGLRFDYYRLSPKTGDSLYSGSPVTTSDYALSPRIAVLYEASSALIPYVQYAHGFRAPTPDQVNNGFSNPALSYMTIGNPDLKPETSNTLEAGLRGTLGTGFGALRYGVTAFAGHYDDFITQRIIRGSRRPNDPQVYQYVNASKARIHGFEGRAEWVMPNGITLKTAMAFTKGSAQDQGGENRPLDTINPFSAVFGVRYEPTERWYVQSDLLFQAAKRAKDMDSSANCYINFQNTPCFAPPSSFIVDVRGGYRFNKHVSATIGIHNLFDRKYWNWSDVRGIAADSQVLDAYSAPGRTVAVSMKVDF
ncbi:TonB-dependent hemoglobin/transferrin/lactoferrin family receptor [Burkholderia sp. 4701]|nr:TonB-dependent hemoglobin/transferrin/lactoferrin family receptor [Burkholderia sp. 4701]MXN85270.1 TonB-dependent hemoglobin/transferrin/lactoferrin family receptor [Burkholderia sp. 4812]